VIVAYVSCQFWVLLIQDAESPTPYNNNMKSLRSFALRRNLDTRSHSLGFTVLVMACLSVSAQAADPPVQGVICSADFDADKASEAPGGWEVARTGEGSPRWTVEAEDSAPTKPHVLKQSGVADYSLCIRQGAELKDGFVEMKFKPVSGERDQAGGLVWRYRDAHNYYVARANALENNVVLYKVENGKRTPLDVLGRASGYGVNVPVPKQAWSTLRVEFTGTRFRVFFNGRPLFEVEDATFTTAGRVGLWTKADSLTLFDDFRTGQSARH